VRRREVAEDRQRRVPLVVAWAIFATYVLAARGVRNFFPISVFDMYQAHAPDVVARVMVIDAAGHTEDIEAFDGWVCDGGPPRLRDVERTCGRDHRPLEYVTRDQELWVHGHGGDAPGPEAVTIVSRAYVLGDRAGAPPHSDCTIARCTARRREGR
jgi:hypothetical protein